MISKYTIEYSAHFKSHAQTNHYSSDDPVACEPELADAPALDRVGHPRHAHDGQSTILRL